MRARHRWTAASLACIATLVVAGVGVSGMSEAVADSKAETLFAAIPAGWGRVTRRDVGARRLEEYVPAGQDADHWTEMITVITIDGLQGFDPDEHVATMSKRYRLACESFRADKVIAAQAGPRRSASTAYWCSQYRQQAQGEIKFVRFLEGDGRLFVVERVLRGAPFDLEHPPLTPEREREWRAQLGAVRVCGAKDACGKDSR